MRGFYDPESYNFCSIMRDSSGIASEVLCSSSFWFFVVMHIVLMLMFHFAPHVWDFIGFELDWKATGAVTSLLTFFIVFYGTNCYSRYQMFYSHCVGLGGIIQEWSALVTLHFPKDNVGRWNGTRYMLASMHVLFYSLNQSHGGVSISEEEWATIKERCLLNEPEIEAITAYPGLKALLPIIWALGEVEEVMGPKEDPSAHALRSIDLLQAFRTLGFSFRGHCGQITNWIKNPVPFPYFAFLYMLLAVDLTLVSVGLVSIDFGWTLTIVSYLAILSAFLGLKAVAIKMSDPFGAKIHRPRTLAAP